MPNRAPVFADFTLLLFNPIRRRQKSPPSLSLLRVVFSHPVNTSHTAGRGGGGGRCRPRWLIHSDCRAVNREPEAEKGGGGQPGFVFVVDLNKLCSSVRPFVSSVSLDGWKTRVWCRRPPRRRSGAKRFNNRVRRLRSLDWDEDGRARKRGREKTEREDRERLRREKIS